MTEQGPPAASRRSGARQAEAALRQAEIALRQARASSAVETLARRDPFWPAQLTVLAAIVLSLDLPSRLTSSKVWLIPVDRGRAARRAGRDDAVGAERRHPMRRNVALALVGLVTLSNLVNLGLLVHTLLHHRGARRTAAVAQLILAGVEIWVTNVLLFTVWYWELDRGGPIARRRSSCPPPDFYFPQMTDPRWAAWTGARATSTTSTRRSRTRPPSARPTRCR